MILPVTLLVHIKTTLSLGCEYVRVRGPPMCIMGRLGNQSGLVSETGVPERRYIQSLARENAWVAGWPLPERTSWLLPQQMCRHSILSLDQEVA
jgi:hypothetical protein